MIKKLTNHDNYNSLKLLNVIIIFSEWETIIFDKTKQVAITYISGYYGL